MKSGPSSLNPFAASYVPLSKRGVATDGSSEFYPGQELPSGREMVWFGHQPANVLNHFHQQNASQGYLHHLGSASKWNFHPSSEFYASSSQNQVNTQAKSNINQEFLDLSHLKMKFPGISEESLNDVYLASSCDLDASVDMLNQLELYPDSDALSDKLPDTLDIGDVVAETSSTAAVPKSMLMSNHGGAASKSVSISQFPNLI